jgi:hypothetical protein
MCSLCGTDKDIEYIARNGILEYEFCTPCWDFLSTIVENSYVAYLHRCKSLITVARTGFV